jgi:transcriptional regulator with PAS, ATPase and Fis domain
MPPSPQHIVGTSPAWLAACEDVDLSAELGFDLLLRGASGTGKDGMARRYHERTSREGDFVAVNCAAIPPELFESEFFGHARGAFTGAAGSKDGYFKLADQGTLFLDEVAALSLEFQAKLLRVIEDGVVRPVGSVSTCTVDVRIVAAANENLEDLVAVGRFRNDLYWRLRKTAPVVLPSLSDRRDDIPAIATELLRRTGLGFGIDDHALQALAAGDYSRGNVRELESVICTAVKTARRAGEKRIGIDHVVNCVVETPAVTVVECAVWMSATEACSALGVHRNTLATMVDRGEVERRGQARATRYLIGFRQAHKEAHQGAHQGNQGLTQTRAR